METQEVLVNMPTISGEPYRQILSISNLPYYFKKFLFNLKLTRWYQHLKIYGSKFIKVKIHGKWLKLLVLKRTYCDVPLWLPTKGLVFVMVKPCW